jgi:hypothetical protein
VPPRPPRNLPPPPSFVLTLLHCISKSLAPSSPPPFFLLFSNWHAQLGTAYLLRQGNRPCHLICTPYGQIRRRFRKSFAIPQLPLEYPGEYDRGKFIKSPKKWVGLDEFAGTQETGPDGCSLRPAAGGGTPPWGAAGYRVRLDPDNHRRLLKGCHAGSPDCGWLSIEGEGRAEPRTCSGCRLWGGVCKLKKESAARNWDTPTDSGGEQKAL